MAMSLSDYNLAVSIFCGIWFGLPALWLVIYLFKCIRIVEQGTALVVERFGAFHRRCDAGLHLLIPFVDRARTITWRTAEVFYESKDGLETQTVRFHEVQTDILDLRESVMDFPNQSVITRDNVVVTVHPMLLYRLVDPIRVCYETYDLTLCTERLIQTTLRSIIGDLGLDDTLASREEIEHSLRSKIAGTLFNWGLELRSVELLEISPTQAIQSAMHTQLTAERIRRAAIVTAEGWREKIRLEAEGECQSSIALATGAKSVEVVRSQGFADARRIIANSEAAAVRSLGEALSEFGVDPARYSVGLKYMDALVSLAVGARKRTVCLPLDTDLTGAIGDNSIQGSAR